MFCCFEIGTPEIDLCHNQCETGPEDLNPRGLKLIEGESPSILTDALFFAALLGCIEG